MGYRAGIYVNGILINELPKFYGYIGYMDEDIYEYLPSIKWLVNNKKIDVEDVDIIFLGNWGPCIKFTAREFREFMNLYISDFEKYGREVWCKYPKGYNLLYSKKWLKDVYNNNADKVIEWG